MTFDPQRLGSLTPVDLRTIWPDEARDFTPWLAAHLDRLGDALDVGGLTLVEQEMSVGAFSLDILAESGTGARIAIENQLASSDHTHLGQCLTYAAGIGASAVVWITPQLREEHRAALDWLNEHTDASVHFFGVEVSAVRIGDSNPAPVFTVVCRPNDWQATAKAIVKAPEHTKTLDEYLQHVENDAGPQFVPVLRSIADWCGANGGTVSFGRRSMFLSWPVPDDPHNCKDSIWPFAFYSTGPVEVVFQHLLRRRPFDDEALREELRQRVNRIPGVRPIPEDALARRPSFDYRVLGTESAFDAFMDTLTWFVERVRVATASR